MSSFEKIIGQIIGFQSTIVKLTAENYAERFSKLVATPYVSDPKYAQRVARNIFLAFKSNPTKANILARLAKDLQAHWGDACEKNVFDEELADTIRLNPLSSPVHVYVFLNFIPYLYAEGVVTLDALINEVRHSEFGDDQKILILATCGDILEQKDRKLFGYLYNSLDPGNSKVTKSAQLLEIEKYCQHKWSYLHERVKPGFNPQSLLDILMLDRDDLLKAKVKKPNAICEWSPLFVHEFLMDDPPVLFVAAMFGAVKCYKLLGAMGASIQAEDMAGRTIVEFASAGDNPEIIGDMQGSLLAAIQFQRDDLFYKLIAAEYGDEGIDERGWFELSSVAASANNLHAMQYLMQKTRSKEILQDHCTAVILYAIKYSQIEFVELVLSAYSNLEDRADIIKTGILLALRKKFTPAIEIFVARKDLPLGGKTDDGKTYLYKAIESNNTAAARLLMQREEIPKDVPMSMMTAEQKLMFLELDEYQPEEGAAHECIVNGEADVLEYMLVHKKVEPNVVYEDHTLLHLATLRQSLTMVKILLNNDADPNCRNKEEFTPLHFAAALNNIELARALLEKCDPKCALGEEGITPLMIAIDEDFVDMAKLIISKGGQSEEALYAAIIRGSTTIAKELVPCTDSGQFFPLICYLGLEDLMTFMIEREGFDVNVTDSQGYTALHRICQRNSMELFDKLISLGNVNLNIQGEDGATPVHLAVFLKRIAILKRLVELEADLSLKMASGPTALDLALDKHNLDALKVLLTSAKLAIDESTVERGWNTAARSAIEEKLAEIKRVNEEAEAAAEGDQASKEAPDDSGTTDTSPPDEPAPAE